MEHKKLGPYDLEAFMQENGIPGEILHLAVPTPTVERAAQAVGVQNDQIVKTVIFLINQAPLKAIACGTAPIDRRAIAAWYGVGRKKVKLAPAEAVLALTGYPAGAVPPFGHLQKIPAVIDPRVLDQPEVYAGGGSEKTLVRLNPRLIHSQTGAQILDLRGGD